MLEDLGLREGSTDGWCDTRRRLRPRSHRHVELELNLVVGGTASYLLDDRRYDLTAGTLTWLFPDQEHVLVDESADHALWWAVFRPQPWLGSRLTHARPLLERDPVGRYSRRLDPQRVQRLAALFGELREAETLDDTLFNAGLAYLLALAWRAFLDSDRCRRRPRGPSRGRRRGTSPAGRPRRRRPDRPGTQGRAEPPHLSRLFTAQMGLSITRFRNQQRLDRFMRLYGQGRGTDSARGCPRGRVWQLRTVPSGVPQGDRPPPLRPPHLSHRRPMDPDHPAQPSTPTTSPSNHQIDPP